MDMKCMMMSLRRYTFLQDIKNRTTNLLYYIVLLGNLCTLMMRWLLHLGNRCLQGMKSMTMSQYYCIFLLDI